MQTTSLVKPFLINAMIIILIMSIVGLIDYELEFGRFQGLLFYTLALYGCGLLFIINGLLALNYGFKKQKSKAKRIFFAGLLSTGATAALLYLSARWIQAF